MTDRSATVEVAQVAPPRIREGVFFATPATLPRGRHAIARGTIVAAQRERLMIAVTELMAHRGYRAIGVRDVARLAKVSQAAFYRCFADKDECIFAAYDRFIALLIDRVATVVAVEGPWERTITGVVTAYLETLESDPVVGRAFQVEMDALGRPARDQRRQALVGLAMLLKGERERRWPDAPSVADSAYVGAVYAIRQLASDAIDTSRDIDLLTHAPEYAAWVGALFDPRAG